MKNIIFVIFFCIVNSLIGYSQTDSRYVISINEFDNSKTNSNFARLVAEKVDAIVTKSKRFVVVNRLNYSSIEKEREFQKREEFIGSEIVGEQKSQIKNNFIINGSIIKLPVYAMKNPDGTVNGYRGSVSFELKMVDIQSTQSTEAESFESDDSPLMLSPESALNEALKSIEPNLIEWLNKTFPLRTFVKELLTSKNNEAKTILIGGGRTFGFKVGDELAVQIVKIIDGKEFPREIGTIEIEKLAGDDFAECSVSDGEEEIYKLLTSTPPVTLKCELKK